jgi:hypothetical protein
VPFLHKFTCVFLGNALTEQGKLEFHQISVTPGMLLTREGSVQRPLTSGPKGWPADQPNFVASHGLASWAHSPGGGNKESEARSH